MYVLDFVCVCMRWFVCLCACACPCVFAVYLCGRIYEHGRAMPQQPLQPLPQGWKETKDEAGQPLFMNVFTKATQSDRPTQVIIPLSSLLLSLSPGSRSIRSITKDLPLHN